MEKTLRLAALVGLLVASCGRTPNPVEQTSDNTQDRLQYVLPEYKVFLEDRLAATLPSERPPRPLSLRKHGAKKTVVVDDDTVECPEADFFKIQDAIDSGAHTIKVCAGTYAEHLVIGLPDAKVKLKGAGMGVTVIQPESPPRQGPIIDVLPGSDVEISNLTVDGVSSLVRRTTLPLDAGIRYLGAGGKVKKVELVNLRNASGSFLADAIWVEAWSHLDGKVKVTIEKCNISNSGTGIYAIGDGAEITVKRNTFLGLVSPGALLFTSFVVIDYGAKGVVKKNTIGQNSSIIGVAIRRGQGSKVLNNRISVRPGGGVFIASDHSGAIVRGNDIETGSVGSFGSVGIGLGSHTGPNTVNNVVKNNRIRGALIGIVVEGNARDNLVRQNDMRDSKNQGIFVFKGAAGNEFIRNKVRNSGLADLHDRTTGTGTAGTANIWKNNDCTTSFPAGLCR